MDLNNLKKFTIPNGLHRSTILKDNLKKCFVTTFKFSFMLDGTLQSFAFNYIYGICRRFVLYNKFFKCGCIVFINNREGLAH